MIKYVSQNEYFGFIKDDNFVIIGYDIRVTRAWSSLENDDIIFEAEFYVNSTLKKVITSHRTFEEDVNQKGLRYSSSKKQHYDDYIQQQLDQLAKIDNNHQELGWAEVNSSLCFKSNSLIGGSISSTYTGEYDIQPCGDRSAFLEELAHLISTNNKLMLGVVMGLSACVVGFLRANAINIDTILYNMVGRSSTGKSTVAKLAASMGGKVVKIKEGKRSLYGNCSATGNAIEERCNGNFGEPIVFDELGRFKDPTGFTQLIYDLAEGTNKDRLDSNSHLKKPKTWCTSIIFTGEFSILNKADKTDGLSVRVLTFAYDKWTQSPEESHYVERFYTMFSGIGIDMLAKEMLRHKPVVIERAFWRLVKITKNTLQTAPEYCERIGKHVAVMLLSAILAKRAFKLRLDIKNLTDLILTSISGSQQTPTWRTVYEDFYHFVTKHKNRFNNKISNDNSNPRWEGKHITNGRAYGYIQKVTRGRGKRRKLGDTLVFITTSKFDEWIKTKDIPDKNPILDAWKAQGYLHPKDDTHKETIRKISSEKNSSYKGYLIFLEDFLSQEYALVAIPKLKPLSEKEKNRLLDDEDELEDNSAEKSADPVSESRTEVASDVDKQLETSSKERVIADNDTTSANTTPQLTASMLRRRRLNIHPNNESSSKPEESGSKLTDD